MRRASPLLAIAGLAVLVAPIVGCAGHSLAPPSGQTDAGITTVTGAVNGVSIPAAYALAVADDSATVGTPPNQYARLTIEIASTPLTCTSGGLPDAAYIGIELTASGPNPVGPGTYSIDNNSLGEIENLAALSTTDAMCIPTAPATCTQGTIVVTAVSDAAVTGTFTLAFDDGDTMHGVFAASVCAAAPPALTGAQCN